MRIFRSGKQADAQKQLDRLLIEQSSALLEAGQSGGDAERRALADWLTQSKRHVRTHLFMTTLEEELKQLDPHKQIPIPGVVAGSPPCPELPRPRARPALPRRRFRIASAAAAVLLGVAVALISGPAVDYLAGWRHFETTIGEQRSVSLSDGSIVQMNTGTRLKARVSDTARDVRLLEGEALFKVARDRARPFTVHTSNAAIVAVGTQFNVYQLRAETRVSVLEGRVRVSTSHQPSAPVIPAGHEIQVRHDGETVSRTSPDIANTTAWVQRRVVFKQEPLANVVAQFNRYRKTPQLRIEDPVLAARQYSGTFDVDDPRSLEEVLATEADVVLERTDDEMVIRRRAALTR
jgi:transmembrane sensor